MSFIKDHNLFVSSTGHSDRGLFTTCKLKPGDVVFEEQPLVHAFNNDCCHECLAKKSTNNNLFRCHGCQFAYYCNQECQTKNWKKHRLRCRTIKSLMYSRKRRIASNTASTANEKLLSLPTKTVICVSELLLKISIMKNNNSNSSLISSISEMRDHWNHRNDENRKEIINMAACVKMYCNSMKEILLTKNKKSKKKNEAKCNFNFDLQFIERLIAKLTINAISICDYELNPIGIGLFPTLSLINHSCRPNCIAFFNSKNGEINVQLRVVSDIAINEQLFITYIDICQPLFYRRLELQNNYYFQCECQFCNSQMSQLKNRYSCKLCSKVLAFGDCNQIECCSVLYFMNELQEKFQRIELKYKQMANDNKCIKKCNQCLIEMERFLNFSEFVNDENHWLLLRILQMKQKWELNDCQLFEKALMTSKQILELLQNTFLSSYPYSPVLGLQYCLMGKLSNYVINEKMESKRNRNGIDIQSEMKQCALWLRKGLNVVHITHGSEDECSLAKDIELLLSYAAAQCSCMSSDIISE